MTLRPGQSILDEYLNETREKLEDDGIRLRLIQIMHYVYSLIGVLFVFVRIYFVVLAVALVMLIFFLDVDILTALRAASDKQIIEAISCLRVILAFVAIFGFLAFLMFFNGKYFNDKRKERLDREDEEAELLRKIVAVSEEVLVRHKLIEKDVNAK